MPQGMLGRLNELYQENIGQPFVRSPVGQGISGYLGLDPASENAPTEAYRAGQALGTSPALGAPAGAFKASVGAFKAVPGLMEGLTGAALVGMRSSNPKTREMFENIKKLTDIGATRQDIQRVYPSASIVEISPGQYATEISDKASAFTQKLTPGKETSAKLGQILSHEKLFKEYPELKDFPVSVLLDQNARLPRGDFDKTKGIRVTANSPQELLNTLTHEIEHWIQFKEAWPTGGQESAMKVGLGAYKTQIARDSKALNELQRTVSSKQTELTNASPEAARKIQDELVQLNRRSEVFQDRLNTFRQLEKYPSTYDGRFAAYADLWGERAARAASDRRLLTEQERMQQPLQAYIDQEIRKTDATRPEFQSYGPARPIPLQENPLKAQRILKPLQTDDPLNRGMKINTPQDAIPYGDIYEDNPFGVPYGNAP